MSLPCMAHAHKYSHVCDILQAEAVLGMSADEIARLKVGEDEAAFQEALKCVQWSEWTLHIQTRTQCASMDCCH